MTTSSFISVWLAQIFKPLQMFPAKYFPRIKIQFFWLRRNAATNLQRSNFFTSIWQLLLYKKKQLFYNIALGNGSSVKHIDKAANAHLVFSNWLWIISKSKLPLLCLFARLTYSLAFIDKYKFCTLIIY